MRIVALFEERDGTPIDNVEISYEIDSEARTAWIKFRKIILDACCQVTVTKSNRWEKG